MVLGRDGLEDVLGVENERKRKQWKPRQKRGGAGSGSWVQEATGQRHFGSGWPDPLLSAGELFQSGQIGQAVLRGTECSIVKRPVRVRNGGEMFIENCGAVF